MGDQDKTTVKAKKQDPDKTTVKAPAQKEKPQRDPSEARWKKLQGQYESLIQKNISRGGLTLEDQRKLDELDKEMQVLRRGRKIGFRPPQARSTPKDDGARKVRDSSNTKTEKKTVIKEKSSGGGGESILSKLSSMQKLPDAATPSISLYILLLALGGVSLLAKWFFDYDPITSFTVSLVVFILFFLGVLKTPLRKVKLIAVSLMGILDMVVVFGALQFFPTNELRDSLITFHVYGWIALALAFFLMGVFEILGAGEHLGKFGWFMFIVILVIIFLLVLPLVWSVPMLLQQESHAEYFDIANKKVKELVSEGTVGALTFGDFMGCYIEYAFDPTGGKDQTTCRNKKRIERLCRTENPKGGEKYDKCIKEHSESKEQLTARDFLSFAKVSFDFDVVKKYFPSKTKNPRELYSASIKYKDFPEGREVSLGCFFDPDKFQAENVTGLIEGNNPLSLEAGDDSIPINCKPSQDLEPGKYTLYFEATFHGIVSKATRKRFFIKGGSQHEVALAKADVIEVEGGAFAAALKKLEEQEVDLAVPTFGVGNTPDEPIIRADRGVQAGLGIANKGGGELLEIQSFTITAPQGVSGSCFNNNNIELTDVQRKTRKFGLKTCPVTIDGSLADPTNGGQTQRLYDDRELHATLVFDYKITHAEKGIEIEKRE